MVRRVAAPPPRWAAGRLLALAAALAGLFLMHGVRMTAGDCHGTDGHGMVGMAGAVAGMAVPAVGRTESPVPGADGGSHAGCVSTGPRPAPAAVLGLVLLAVAVVPPVARPGRRHSRGRGSPRRGPPSSGALLMSLGVSRT